MANWDRQCCSLSTAVIDNYQSSPGSGIGECGIGGSGPREVKTSDHEENYNQQSLTGQ
jgi:hypothetical protein